MEIEPEREKKREKERERGELCKARVLEPVF